METSLKDKQYPVIEKEHSVINRSNLRNIIIVISFLSALVCPIDSIRIFVSFLLLSMGCFFHFVTKGVLIRNVVLCKDGTYSVVRHPYYLANYLIDSSFCLLSGNIYLLLIYPLLFYWAYGPTLRKEENFLTSIYGDEYVKYSLEIPQIFPDAYSIKNWREIIHGFSRKRITTNELSRMLRFWATGFFIVFLHSITKDGFERLNLSYLKNNHGGLTLLSLVIILYVTSLIIKGKKRETS